MAAVLAPVTVLRVGIAGWSYDDWKGKVYPATCKDTLVFCARHVDLLEINASFYRTPAPATVASWVTRTHDLGTWFTAKLARTFTHERRLEGVEVAAFRDAMAPLCQAGRLRALLAQFPFSFECDAPARAHLARVAAAFADLAPLAVEVRHVSWQTEAALAFLRDLGATVVHLDYPARAQSFAPDLIEPPAHGLVYFRLHGRNDAAWWRPDAGRDAVYDWLYAPSEVCDLAQRVRTIASRGATTLVVANNHFEGKAMKVALELRADVEGTRVAVPEPLLVAYPDLATVARRGGQGRLFG